MSPPQQVAWPLLARMTDFLASYYTYLPLPLSNRLHTLGTVVNRAHDGTKVLTHVGKALTPVMMSSTNELSELGL